MNSLKNVAFGWLHVYVLFIIINIISVIIPLINFFSLSQILLVPFYIVSIVLIYKQSRKAVILNKITLILAIVLEILIFYLFSVPTPENNLPSSVIGLMGMVAISRVIIFALCLVYWFKSKKVKDIFIDNSNKIYETPTQLSVSNIETNSHISNLENSNKVSFVHFSSLAVISILSCVVFLFSGWAALLFVPVSFVFSILYSIFFTKIIIKSNTSTFSVYSVALTLLIAYVSIGLNIGIVSDSENIEYFFPVMFEVSSDPFHDLFGILYSIGLLYLLLSIIFNVFLIKKGSSKLKLSIVPLIGLILVAIHTIIFWQQLPALKEEVIKIEQENHQKEQAMIDEKYIFDWSRIVEDSFKNRVYSIFTPPSPLSGGSTSLCPYTTRIMEQSSGMETFDFSCLNGLMKSIGQIPITETDVLAFEIPNSTNLFKKGDILVVVAELENPSFMRIYANGNAAKDCPCRMSPYDYSGITESIEVGEDRIYEQSVVQIGVSDKKRTVMTFYPINVNNLKYINIKLSQFSENPDTPVILKEVSLLTPTAIYSDPEWLKKWSNQPNPFLNQE